MYTFYGPDEPKFANLTNNFLTKDMDKIMPSLGLDEPIPLWWTTDFILASPEGTPPEEEKWIVGEFNCSCVGISKFQAVCGGEKTLADVPDEDYFDACELTDLMGVKAIEMLDKAKA